MIDKKDYDRLVDFVQDAAEHDCPYEQKCDSVHPSELSHGMCDGCKARILLGELGIPLRYPI